MRCLLNVYFQRGFTVETVGVGVGVDMGVGVDVGVGLGVGLDLVGGVGLAMGVGRGVGGGVGTSMIAAAECSASMMQQTNTMKRYAVGFFIKVKY